MWRLGPSSAVRTNATPSIALTKRMASVHSCKVTYKPPRVGPGRAALPVFYHFGWSQR